MIVNHTDKMLAEQVQRLGLNYAPTPRKIPARDITAAIEDMTSQLGVDDVSDLRLREYRTLLNAKPPERHHHQEVEKSAKRTMKDEGGGDFASRQGERHSIDG